MGSNKTAVPWDNCIPDAGTRITALSEWTFSTPDDNLSRDKCELNRANAAIHIERVYDILLLEIYTGPSWESSRHIIIGLSYIVKSVCVRTMASKWRVTMSITFVISNFTCSALDLIFAEENFWHIVQTVDGDEIRPPEISWNFTARFQHFDVYLRALFETSYILFF